MATRNKRRAIPLKKEIYEKMLNKIAELDIKISVSEFINHAVKHEKLSAKTIKAELSKNYKVKYNFRRKTDQYKLISSYMRKSNEDKLQGLKAKGMVIYFYINIAIDKYCDIVSETITKEIEKMQR
jgi:hypothetical protein